MKKKIIYTVGLAVFVENKILMVNGGRSEDAYYFLGGGIEKGETPRKAIIRETKEEVGVDVDRKTLKFLRVFTAVAYNMENTIVQMRLYTGFLLGEPTPSTEIVALQYMNYEQGMKNTPELSKIVFPWLKAQGYIV